MTTRILAAACALALLPGCFHFKYLSGGPIAPEPTDESWHHGLVWGIAEISDPVNVDHICPDGFGMVKSEESFLNGLVQTVTWSIYSPQTVSVTCAPGPDGKAPTSVNKPWKK